MFIHWVDRCCFQVFHLCTSCQRPKSMLCVPSLWNTFVFQWSIKESNASRALLCFCRKWPHARINTSSLGGKVTMMVLIIVTFNQNKYVPWFARHSNPFQRSIRLDSVHRPEQWQQWEREILLSVIKMVVLCTPSVWCTSTKKRLRRTTCCLRWGKLRIFQAQVARERTGARREAQRPGRTHCNEYRRHRAIQLIAERDY